MYKILAIGNSFSEDATYYLHQILEHSGIENQVVNLYIGGCSLERHIGKISKMTDAIICLRLMDRKRIAM